MPLKQKRCHYKNLFLVVVPFSFPLSFLSASPPGKSLSLIIVFQVYLLTFVLFLPRESNGLPKQSNTSGRKEQEKDPLDIESDEALPPVKPGPGTLIESTTKRGPRQLDEIPITRKEALKVYRSTNAFIRTCGYDGDFGVDATQCTNGVTVKEAFIPGCICLRGVWIIHSKLCTNAPIVLIGRHKNKQFDCYTVDFEVKSFLFLGDPEDPFAPRTYVAPQTMTVFYPIPQNGDWTPVLDFEDPVIISINPKPGTSFEAEETRDCFAQLEFDPKPNEIKVHIWGTALQSTRYRKIDKCTNPERAAYQSIGTHDTVYYHGNQQFSLPVQSCVFPCPVWPDFNTTDTPEKIYYADDIRRIFYHEWVSIFEETPEQRVERLRKKKEQDAEHAKWGVDVKKVMKEAAQRANSLDGKKNEDGEIDRSPKFGFAVEMNLLGDFKSPTADSNTNMENNSTTNTILNEETPGNESETKAVEKPQTALENSTRTETGNEPDTATSAGIVENLSTTPQTFAPSSTSFFNLNSESTQKPNPTELISNSTVGPQNLEMDSKQRRKRKSRKKRKVVVCEVVWRGRGSCLHSYWDPVDKFEMSEQDQKYCFPTLGAQPRPKLPKFG